MITGQSLRAVLRTAFGLASLSLAFSMEIWQDLGAKRDRLSQEQEFCCEVRARIATLRISEQRFSATGWSFANNLERHIAGVVYFDASIFRLEGERLRCDHDPWMGPRSQSFTSGRKSVAYVDAAISRARKQSVRSALMRGVEMLLRDFKFNSD